MRKVLNLSNHRNPDILPNVFDKIAVNEKAKHFTTKLLATSDQSFQTIDIGKDVSRTHIQTSETVHLVTPPPHGVGSGDEQSLQFSEQESSKSTIAQLYEMVGGYFWRTSPAQRPQILSNPVERGCIGGFSEAGRGEWGF